MDNTESITIEKRVELIRAAIEQYDSAHKRWIDGEQDAGLPTMIRMDRRRAVYSCEDEFKWQLNNVRTVLDHYAPVKS